MDRIDSAPALFRRLRRHRAVLGPALLSFARHWLAGSERLPYGPLKLHVEPTSVCNLRCPHCPQAVDAVPRHGYMELELFRALVAQARGVVREINLFFRGESLIHPQLADMARICESAGIVAHVNTNATLLDERRSLALLEAGVGKLTVSFDGLDRESYERMRAGARFERVVANVRRFLELRRARGAARPYVVIQNITLRSQTPGGPQVAPEFEALFEGLGVDEWDALWPHDWAGTFSGLAPRYGERYFACNWLWKSMAVHWDGQVSSCCADFGGKQIVGDLRSQSLAEIWNGPAMRAMRRDHVAGEHVRHPTCAGCDAVWQRSGPAWTAFALASRLLSGGRAPAQARGERVR